MKFDINKVYTSVNADELKIGSRCIFADTMHDLFVLFYKDNSSDFIKELSHINSDSHIYRFNSKNANYILAYLIEPPIDQKEPEYKPFSSMEKLAEAAKKHGYIIHTKTAEVDISLIGLSFCQRVLARINSKGLIFGLTLQELFDEHIFADDGTPCGELVEEEENEL